MITFRNYLLLLLVLLVTLVVVGVARAVQVPDGGSVPPCTAARSGQVIYIVFNGVTYRYTCRYPNGWQRG